MADCCVRRCLIGELSRCCVIGHDGYSALHDIQDCAGGGKPLLGPRDGRIADQRYGAFVIFDREFTDGDDIRFVGKGREFHAVVFLYFYSLNLGRVATEGFVRDPPDGTIAPMSLGTTWKSIPYDTRS